MTEEEILVETSDGKAGIRYLPEGGPSKEGETLQPKTVEIYTEGNVEFSQINTNLETQKQ